MCLNVFKKVEKKCTLGWDRHFCGLDSEPLAVRTKFLTYTCTYKIGTAGHCFDLDGIQIMGRASKKFVRNSVVPYQIKVSDCISLYQIGA